MRREGSRLLSENRPGLAVSLGVLLLQSITVCVGHQADGAVTREVKWSMITTLLQPQSSQSLQAL